jgi:hypothetical protein
MRIFWPVDGQQRLVELQFNSSGRPDGANYRVGVVFALKEAETGRSRRTHHQDDPYSTRRRRSAKQPPTFAEGRKIDAGGGKPSACSIARPKSQGGLLVAVGNPQWGIGLRILPSRR